VGQRSIELIMLRQVASALLTPIFLVDVQGTLVYFNEAAEEVLGRSFAESGELPASEWASIFTVRDQEGNPAELSDMPAGVALLEQRPAHGTLQIVALDEVRRRIEVTAIPLLASRGEPIGVIAIFWPK
jgi:PAS domain-containing protein